MTGERILCQPTRVRILPYLFHPLRLLTSNMCMAAWRRAPASRIHKVAFGICQYTWARQLLSYKLQAFYIYINLLVCSALDETLIPMNGKEEKTSIALTAPQQSRDLQSSSIPSNRTAATEKQEPDRNGSPIHKSLKIALLSLVAVIGVLVLLLPSIAYYLPLPSVSFFFTLSPNLL